MNCRVALTRLEVEGPAARRHAAPLHSCKYRWLHAPATKFRGSLNEENRSLAAPETCSRIAGQRGHWLECRHQRGIHTMKERLTLRLEPAL
jgi:hypothetical protein